MACWDYIYSIYSRSLRHLKFDLVFLVLMSQIGHSLLSMAASDPGGQGAEEEWVRWLQVHGVGPKA